MPIYLAPNARPAYFLVQEGICTRTTRIEV
jgi:hypothetical protein